MPQGSIDTYHNDDLPIFPCLWLFMIMKTCITCLLLKYAERQKGWCSTEIEWDLAFAKNHTPLNPAEEQE